MKSMLRILGVTLIIMLLSSSLVACGAAAPASSGTAKTSQTQTGGELKKFTLEELKKYDGQNGNPAYIAVDGKVYDVSNAEPWKGGKHNGYGAGMDLTEEIKTKSPHGLSKLDLVPVVGELMK